MRSMIVEWQCSRCGQTANPSMNIAGGGVCSICERYVCPKCVSVSGLFRRRRIVCRDCAGKDKPLDDNLPAKLE